MHDDDVVNALLPEPKLTAGETIYPEPDPDRKPQRAAVIRTPGEEPQAVPVKRKPGRPRGSGKAAREPLHCLNDHAMTDAMKFCPECGSRARTAGPQACPNGHAVAEGFKFCQECGAGMSAASLRELVVAQQLSPEELLSKEQAHKIAVAMGNGNPVLAYASGQAPPNVQPVVIHLLIDGFTAFGNVWYRGQEMELWPGHPRWSEAQSWITLDTAGQYARFGRQVFGNGPWPGVRSYTAGSGHFQPLEAVGGGSVEPTEDELKAADRKEQQRGRRVPLPIS
jgi:hypothetical protein